MKLLLLLLPLLLLACQAASATRPAGSHAYTPLHKKQVIVIVHGAWGGGWAFREVDDLLTDEGYKVYRPTVTGQGERSHLATPDIGLDTHVQDIVNVILFEDLHDIVLVGHSYGGMVITGVAQKVPDRIKQLIYVDALLPNDGESANSMALLKGDKPRAAVDGFIPATWLKPTDPLPHDVPHPAKTFSDTISIKNPAAEKIPTSYLLTVDPGKKDTEDAFYFYYLRAKAHGWPVAEMESDHNMQWSHPREFVAMLKKLM